MNDKNTDINLETESQSIDKSTQPWYKKKSTIIASSSILGAGLLATVIAVPIALTSNNAINPNIGGTINILNQKENYNSRLSIWDGYIKSLSLPFPNTNNSLFSQMVSSDSFINEFINFLFDNLYVTATGAETGAISQSDQSLMKLEISKNKASFKDETLTYSNLFSFAPQNSSMFTFRDKASNPTIEFTLVMPINNVDGPGIDLIYNENQTVAFKTPVYSATSQNAKLVITKFSSPNIASVKDIYFKADVPINLPNRIMSEFPSYFLKAIKLEEEDRNKLQDNLSKIDKNISNDKTLTTGLSYWNSFALNYALSNTNFITADLKKSVDQSGLYKFLQEAKTVSNESINANDFSNLQTIANAGQIGLQAIPYISSPSHVNTLFSTTNTTGDKYSLKLNITGFSYTFKIESLFNDSNPIKLIPNLKLSGTLTKTTTSPDAAIDYILADNSYDISGLVNMSNNSTTSSGGLIGFLNILSIKDNTIATLTDGLVLLNSKPIDQQIDFWNKFNDANATSITNVIKNSNALSSFITDNLDIKNPAGTDTNFPTAVPKLLESINEAAKNISTSKLSFVDNGIPSIILKDIQWGANLTDKFTSVSIYFGNEKNASISNFNATSVDKGVSNVSLSQKLGETSGFSNKESVNIAASKRISIVFETTTQSYVFYLGQYNNIATPIIIPGTILTFATGFDNSIRTLTIKN